MGTLREPFAVRVSDLIVGFGDQIVLDHLSFDIRKGEIMGLVGASGGGKSVLLRTIIGLIPKRQGRIEVLGLDLDSHADQGRRSIERRWGILFQQGALFSSLSVLQNVQFPMREYLNVSEQLMRDVAAAKLEMVGLGPDDAEKFPSQLSGGMTKRAALARALALDPEIVFLDEPTSGLDPITAGEFDRLIRTLQQTLGLTVLMVTHDLDSLHAVCDRIAVLADGKTLRYRLRDDDRHPGVYPPLCPVRHRGPALCATGCRLYRLDLGQPADLDHGHAGPVLLSPIRQQGTRAKDALLVRWLKRGNERLLRAAFRRKALLFTTVGLAVAVAGYAVTLLPRAFLPPFNEGTLVLSLQYQPGISLAESHRLGLIAERLLQQVPEVKTVGRRTGRAELDEHAEGVHSSEVDVDLKRSARPKEAIYRDIRAAFRPSRCRSTSASRSGTGSTTCSRASEPRSP